MTHLKVKGSQAPPVCPSDKSSIELKMSMEHWWNDAVRETPVTVPLCPPHWWNDAVRETPVTVPLYPPHWWNDAVRETPFTVPLYPPHLWNDAVRETPVTVPLCPLQISRRLAWNRTHASAVRSATDGLSHGATPCVVKDFTYRLECLWHGCEQWPCVLEGIALRSLVQIKNVCLKFFFRSV